MTAAVTRDSSEAKISVAMRYFRWIMSLANAWAAVLLNDRSRWESWDRVNLTFQFGVVRSKTRSSFTSNAWQPTPAYVPSKPGSLVVAALG